VPPNRTPWASPPLSTSSGAAEACYRHGIAALVAGSSHAGDLLDAALAADPDFLLARVAVAVLVALAGRPYVAPERTPDAFRAERQHAEIVAAAFTGDRRRAVDLRREHLVEFPADLLIVWLPLLQPRPSNAR
jgi:hypothetical protein